MPDTVLRSVASITFCRPMYLQLCRARKASSPARLFQLKRSSLFSWNSLAGEEAFLALHNWRYIGRQNVSDATDLNTVSGIIKQGKIARSYSVHKGGKLSNKIAAAKVGCELNLKAERLQRGLS